MTGDSPSEVVAEQQCIAMPQKVGLNETNTCLMYCWLVKCCVKSLSFYKVGPSTLTHHVPRLDLAGSTEGRRATDPKQSLEQANERFNLEKLGKCSLREQ